MLNHEVITRLAHELHAAEKARKPIEQMSKRYPDLTIEDAYKISSAWVDIKREAGQRVIGHKIGLTSRAMQQAAKINEPDYGALLNAMVFEQGGDIPIDRFIAPKVEIELAFILKHPLKGSTVSVVDVLAATEYVVPAVEIVDSRVMAVDPETNATRKIQDTIADNAANAGIILGGRPVRPDAIDLRWVGGLLTRNGVIEETGISAGVLNHPAQGIAWLARKLSLWNEGLVAGEILLGGSFTRLVLASPNDVFHADFGSLGSISFRFV